MTCPLLKPLYTFDSMFRRHAVQNRWTLRDVERMRLDRHHVWPGQRIDVPSNLLDINCVVHDYLHQHPIELRIAGIHARSQQPDFSWEELNQAAGLNVLGWMQQRKCEGLRRPYCWWREVMLNGDV